MARVKQTARMSTGGKVVKGPRRCTVTVREIRRYERSTQLQIPKLTFLRIAKEILRDINREFRFQTAAIGTLHEAAEDYLIERFQNILRESTLDQLPPP